MSVLVNTSPPIILPRLISLLLSILYLLCLNKLNLAPRFVNTFYIYIYIIFFLSPLYYTMDNTAYAASRLWRYSSIYINPF